MRPNLLNMISTPVAVLNGTGLVTSIGLSGDDPLTQRNSTEVFRLLVSVYEPGGSKVLKRTEIGEIGPGDRKIVNLSDITRPLVGDRNTVAVVHRIPKSVCPPGQEPDRDVPEGVNPRKYHMYRGMVQYALPGRGHGSVLYETPPLFNDARGRARGWKTLMFTSKIAASETTETYICLINPSTDPAYAKTSHLSGQLLDEQGRRVADIEATVPPFGVTLVSVQDLLRNAGKLPPRLKTYSVVLHGGDAATIPLLIQVCNRLGAVSVEHTHAPQSYLMPSFGSATNQIRDQALDVWMSSQGPIS